MSALSSQAGAPAWIAACVVIAVVGVARVARRPALSPAALPLALLAGWSAAVRVDGAFRTPWSRVGPAIALAWLGGRLIQRLGRKRMRTRGVALAGLSAIAGGWMVLGPAVPDSSAAVHAISEAGIAGAFLFALAWSMAGADSAWAPVAAAATLWAGFRFAAAASLPAELAVVILVASVAAAIATRPKATDAWVPAFAIGTTAAAALLSSGRAPWAATRLDCAAAAPLVCLCLLLAMRRRVGRTAGAFGAAVAAVLVTWLTGDLLR